MPYRSMNVPPVDIWGGYNQSLATIGQGIADYIREERRKKEVKRLEEEAYQLGRKREKEEYQLGRSREEEDYRLKKQREGGEAGEKRRQATELLTQKYQGYQLANPPLRISEIQPLSRAGQRMEESPSSLAHLLRGKLEEMTPGIVEKTEVPDIPENLGEEIYGDIIKKALIQQGLLPGQGEWTSAGDGALYNKYTAETKPIPGWKPTPTKKVGDTDTRRVGDYHVTYRITGYGADGLPIEQEISRSRIREGDSPDMKAERRGRQATGQFRMRALSFLRTEPDSVTGRSFVPEKLRDAEQFLINRATDLYAYDDNMTMSKAWDTAVAEAKASGLIPQPAPAPPPEKGWFDWWGNDKPEAATTPAPAPTLTQEDAIKELTQRGRTIAPSGAIVRPEQQSVSNGNIATAMKTTIAEPKPGLKQPLYAVEKTQTGTGMFNQPKSGHRELYNPEVGKIYLRKDKNGVSQLGRPIYAYRKVRFLGYRNGEPQFEVVDNKIIPID